MLRRHFDQLASPESWQSPVSVIAHIDLDAFYAQCLTVRYNIDPDAPLGCRQWNSLIAINYPARKYGLKRGVTADEARRLCPQIKLPHVATFKKGETEWKFHDDPDPYNYKVSLDPFRRESRRIFAVFKQHFRIVEKAGIDEGFVDLGPEIHSLIVTSHKDRLKEDPLNPGMIDITYEDLLDIGAMLVEKTRLDIFNELHYTCSAGIASNKLLAKLGSQYKKPFQQTVVYPADVPKFLANFKITDAWGWGGKNGKEVLQILGINAEAEDIDQCAFVRDNFTLSDLEKKLGDFPRARRIYDLVRGNEATEIKLRTLPKSLVAVKNFTTGVPIQTEDDLDMWLRVFAADLAGRVADIQEDYGGAISAKTIGVKFHANKAMHSKQQPFDGNGMSIDQLRDQIFVQSRSVGQNFLPIPCRYLVVELAGLMPLPKERLLFQKTTKASIQEQLKNLPKPSGKLEEAKLVESNESKRVSKSTSITDMFKTKHPSNSQASSSQASSSPVPSAPATNAKVPNSNACDHVAPNPSEHTMKEVLFMEDDEPLFVDDDGYECPRCGARILSTNRQEHDDWHFAKDLYDRDLPKPKSPANPSPPKRRAEPAKRIKAKKKDQNQQSILEFFKK